MVLPCCCLLDLFLFGLMMVTALTQGLVVVFELMKEESLGQHSLTMFAEAPSLASPSPSSVGKLIAVVIPYVGESVPAWWDLFASSCGAQSNFDFLIFLQNPNAFVSSSATNVKIISLGIENFAKLHASVVNGSRWREMMDIFARDPRRLVEFKPAIGVIFARYLSNYSHWAFADLDILIGSFTSFKDEYDDLDAFDVVSYSFGDQSRAYVRGQFTVHKNNDDVNNAFRHCDYFSNQDRLATAASTRVHYESSEGCYSLAVRKAGLRVKFEVNHFTDAEPRTPPTFLFDGEARRCLTRSWKDNACRPLVESGAFKQRRRGYNPSSSFRQFVGLKRSARCMRWVNPRYQPCLESGMPNETIILEKDGKYYRTGRGNSLTAQDDESPSRRSLVEIRAFFHFQEWKKKFHSFSAWPHPHSSYITEEFSPLQLKAVARKRTELVRNFARPKGLSVLATPQGFVPIPSVRPREPWSHARLRQDVEDAVPLRVDPVRCAFNSCGPTVERHFKSSEMSVLCGEKESLLRVRRTGVSLAIAAHDLTPTVASNARAWGRDGGGPIVIALSTTRVSSKSSWCSRLQQPFESNSSSLVVVLGMDGAPLKALLNVATDLAPTRFVLPLLGSQKLCPSCYAAIVDDILNGATSPKTRLAATGSTTPRVERGTTIVIPEFAEDGRTPATRCGGSEPALSDHAYRQWSLLLNSSVDDVLLRQGRSLLSMNECAPVVVVDNLDHRGDRRLVRHLEELGDVGCYDTAFVRSLKLHHLGEGSLRLARRAFITTSARNQQDETCGCPDLERAKSAIRGYASFLGDANELKVLVDREVDLRHAAVSSSNLQAAPQKTLSSQS